MSIEVIKAGLWSSIQDEGRKGFASFGVPKSGAMDSYSAAFANALLGNPSNAALMEITNFGPKLLFHQACAVSLSGLDAEIFLNDEEVVINEAFVLKKADVLEVRRTLKGSRVYLAVKGGFRTEKVLGSRCMYEDVTKDFKIRKGDVLEIKKYNRVFSNKLSVVRFKHELYNQKIEVFPGPEYNLLSTEIKASLFESSYSLSADSNRMAFVCNELLENGLQNMHTCAVLPGSVQLTAGGKLIILMRDCQLSGGYPRVLQLTENSINKLSQINGEGIVFEMLK